MWFSHVIQFICFNCTDFTGKSCDLLFCPGSHSFSCFSFHALVTWFSVVSDVFLFWRDMTFFFHERVTCFPFSSKSPYHHSVSQQLSGFFKDPIAVIPQRPRSLFSPPRRLYDLSPPFVFLIIDPLVLMASPEGSRGITRGWCMGRWGGSARRRANKPSARKEEMHHIPPSSLQSGLLPIPMQTCTLKKYPSS